MAESPTTLLNKVFDVLATDIVNGTYPPKSRFTLNDICSRFDISRTVAREAMRALEQINMVRSSRRVGITVLPKSEWAVFDAKVIAHRLGNEMELPKQLRSLTELRTAVEPVAAAAMAMHASEEERQKLAELSARLRHLGENGRGDSQEFLTLDIEFHILILRASRNEMFAALAPAVAEVLKGRTQFGLQPAHPANEALDRHDALAESIARGDRAAAEMHSRALLTEVAAALADAGSDAEKRRTPEQRARARQAAEVQRAEDAKKFGTNTNDPAANSTSLKSAANPYADSPVQ